MKTTIMAGALAIACVAPAFAQDAEPAPEPIWGGVPAGIEKALKDYVYGAQDGDQARMAEGFDTERGVMYSVRRSEDGDELRATSFEDFLGYFGEPNPIQTSGRILGFDMVEDHMAFVKFEYVEGDDRYIDYLTLMRVGEDWRIVAKAYWYQPPAQSEEE
jgi:hypothetical protein